MNTFYEATPGPDAPALRTEQHRYLEHAGHTFRAVDCATSLHLGDRLIGVVAFDDETTGWYCLDADGYPGTEWPRQFFPTLAEAVDAFIAEHSDG